MLIPGDKVSLFYSANGKDQLFIKVDGSNCVVSIRSVRGIELLPIHPYHFHEETSNGSAPFWDAQEKVVAHCENNRDQYSLAEEVGIISAESEELLKLETSDVVIHGNFISSCEHHVQRRSYLIGFTSEEYNVGYGVYSIIDEINYWNK